MSEVEFPKPWEIPATWEWQRIGEVCAVVGGATPDTNDPRNFDGGDVPWITPADLSGYREKYIARGERNLTKVGLDSSSARLLPKGSVLFSSRAPVGYVAIAEHPLATNQGFKSFVPPAEIASDYLYYYLQRAKLLALELASGTTFQEVSGKRAAQIPLAIAPMHEQPRIVAKLEELFSDLDAGVAALERARGNLKRYRAAVLKAAVEGRLTEQWRKAHPDVEPASKLLERILAERRRKWEEAQLAKFAAAGKAPPKGWKDKYREPSKSDLGNLPKLPENWCWATMEQVSTKVVDGVHKKPEYVPDGVPFVTVRNLTAGPGISFSRINYVSEDDHREFVKRANPERGDILITKDGTLGVIRVVRTDTVFSIFVSVAMIKPVFYDLSDYLGLALDSPQVQVQMVPKGSGLQHIHLEDLRQDAVPLAPLAEQAEILKGVDERFSSVQYAERLLDAGDQRCNRLWQSILKRAFEGKLVPQDPNDEPASVLLERIRSARAAQNPPRAQKRRKALA